MNSTDSASQITLFSALAAQGKLGHAYLFVGAQAERVLEMQCACIAAVRDTGLSIEESSHPREEDMDIDRMRDIIRSAQLSSRDKGGITIVRLDGVEGYSMQVLNALLKTLEEPRKGIIFFLSAPSPRAVLGTIVSRCQQIRIPYTPVVQEFKWSSEEEWYTFCQNASNEELESAISFIARTNTEKNAMIRTMMAEYIRGRHMESRSVKKEYTRDLFAVSKDAV